MINYNTVEEIYSRNFGSELLYKRPYCHSLSYTEGLKDFQQTLSAYWVVDNVITYMPAMIKTFKETEDTFYIVEIYVNQDKQGYMEVYHEGYIDDKYNEHVTVIRQDIPFIDLPVKVNAKVTTYKFYLILNNFEPMQFCMLLPSEY